MTSCCYIKSRGVELYYYSYLFYCLIKEDFNTAIINAITHLLYIHILYSLVTIIIIHITISYIYIAIVL